MRHHSPAPSSMVGPARIAATLALALVVGAGCGGTAPILDDARAAETAGQPEVALALYRAAHADAPLVPADALAMHYLLRTEAEAHATEGWWQQAERLWVEAAALDVPGTLRAEALIRAVDMGALRGAPAAELAGRLEDAHRADPSLDRMAEVADLWQQAGDPAAALRALEAAVDRHPDDIALVLTLAGARVGSGQDADALALYDRVLAADPHHPQAWTMVATLRERGGDLAGAEDAWQALVDAWPDVPGGWIRFAAFVERTGDAARAERLRARAAALVEAR